jgi:hypothetical protein
VERRCQQQRQRRLRDGLEAPAPHLHRAEGHQRVLGDEYVDWVGVSGYNLHRETPDTLFTPIYQAYAARKPLLITEVGAVDRGGRTKADWITLFARWVEAHPGVGGVAWFDTDTHPGSDEKWRVDTDAESLAAYRAMAASARFSG